MPISQNHIRREEKIKPSGLSKYTFRYSKCYINQKTHFFELCSAYRTTVLIRDAHSAFEVAFGHRIIDNHIIILG